MPNRVLPRLILLSCTPSFILYTSYTLIFDRDGGDGSQVWISKTTTPDIGEGTLADTAYLSV